tara:strand:+ start:2984 stop:3394 length:411 start_codon:yes stop_codon:yes gene_type:complete
MLLKLSSPSKSKAISLTPLIDVVFILLLFFMLSSSFSRWFAIDVSMPMTAKTEQNESVRIRILNSQGQLSINNELVNFKDEKLINLLEQQASSVILIDAENKVSTQALVSLMDQLETLGVEGVSLGNTFDGSGGSL